MGRKIFLSVLGTGYYNRTKYYFKDKENFIETRFIQEASLKLLTNDWNENDRAFFFLTAEAKEANWNNPAQTKNYLVKKGERDTYSGLSELIDNCQFPFKIIPIDISDGNNEKEIWEIFEKVYTALKPGDEVFFDITHAFRSIPMLVMVLINFAKFLKNITVKNITYGNWEGRNTETNQAPIIDLTSFSELQDWTNAASEFLNAGRLNKVISLLQIKNINERDDFSNDILTCRGISILNSSHIVALKKKLNNSGQKEVQVPFAAIKEKISEKIKDFKQEDVLNGFRAVKYCIDFDLIQQGITFLIESIITKVLIDIGLKNRQQLASYKIRNIVSVCLQNDSATDVNILSLLSQREQKFQKEKLEKVISRYSMYRDKVFSLEYKDKLTNLVFKDLSGKVRNDINHSGWRSEPMLASEFKYYLKEKYNLVEQIIL